MRNDVFLQQLSNSVQKRLAAQRGDQMQNEPKVSGGQVRTGPGESGESVPAVAPQPPERGAVGQEGLRFDIALALDRLIHDAIAIEGEYERERR